MNEAETRDETQRLESLYRQKLTALNDLKNSCCTRLSAARCDKKIPFPLPVRAIDTSRHE